jgi:hypothetical protein
MLTMSCDYNSESLNVKKHCNITFESYHVIELHELTPPVYLIDHIVHNTDGKLYFSQFREPTIGRFDADGIFLDWIGRYGQGPGEFLSSYIGIDSNDSLFIQDHLSGKITVFAKNEYSNPARIFNYQRLQGDLILTKPGEYLTFQSFPLINLHSSNDSVFILNIDKNGLVRDTILSITGPEFIVDQTDKQVKIIHVADRRNVTFQFKETKFILFENDTDVVSTFDYSGNKLYEKSYPTPPVVDYASLVKRQFTHVSGLSGEKLALELERLTKNNPPVKLALYEEAIIIDDNYFFKLISNEQNAIWMSHKNNHLDNTTEIYCHDNPSMSLKGHNGKYYYGLAFTSDFEQQLHLMVPSD